MKHFRFAVILLIFVSIVLACSMFEAQPAQNSNAIYTSAAQTVQARLSAVPPSVTVQQPLSRNPCLSPKRPQRDVRTRR